MSKVEVTKAGDLKTINSDGGTKPGMRSTEFWAVSVTSGLLMIIAVLNRAFGWDIEYSEADAGALVAGLVAVYAGGRSLVKAVSEGSAGKVAAVAAKEKP